MLNDNLRKTKIIRIAILLIGWLYIFLSVNFTGYEQRLGRDTSYYVPIQKGSEVRQSFIAKGNGLCSFSLRIGNYCNRNNNSDLFIELYEKSTDGENIKIMEKDVCANDFKVDCGDYFFPFEKIDDSKGKYYEIVVRGKDGKNDNCIALAVGDSKTALQTVVVNEKSMGDILVSNVKYNGINDLKLYIAGILFLISLILTYFGITPDEKGFLLFSLLFAMMLLVFIPFPHPLDESSHFFRSFNLSHGDFESIKMPDGRTGGFVSSNYKTDICFKDLCDNEVLSSKEAFDSNYVFYPMHYFSSSISLLYLPSAMGILLARQIGLNIVFTVYLGRFINYLVFVLFAYLAIKNTEEFKRIFFWVASSGTVVALAASYSIDSILIAIIMLFISLCMKYMNSNSLITVSRLDVFAMCAIGVAVSTVKMFVYTPILLLFLLIPVDKFESKEQRKKIILTMLGLLSIVLVYQLSLLYRLPFVEDRNGNVDVIEQIKYVFNNIPQTVLMFTNQFVNNLLYRISSSYYCFIPLEQNVNMVESIGVFSIFVALFGKNKDLETDKKRKLILWGSVISFIVVLLVMASLYVGFTPVGGRVIDGIQSRYFVPIVPLIMILISFVPVQYRGKFDNCLLAVPAILVCSTVMINCV